jgi:carbon-monoxide dehydrogenase medium subunit
MLTALGARVRIRSVDGAREEPLASFLVAGYETTLAPHELVTDIVVPPVGGRMRYVKFTTRSMEDRPAAGIAVVLRADGVRCEELRLVVGAVSPAPVRVDEAERLAAGERLTAALADELGTLAAAAVDPSDDVRGSASYKRQLVRVLVRRAVLDVAAAEVAA